MFMYVWSYISDRLAVRNDKCHTSIALIKCKIMLLFGNIALCNYVCACLFLSSVFYWQGIDYLHELNFADAHILVLSSNIHERRHQYVLWILITGSLCSANMGKFILGEKSQTVLIFKYNGDILALCFGGNCRLLWRNEVGHPFPCWINGCVIVCVQHDVSIRGPFS